MPEHYTKNVIADTHWCAKCQRHTQHRVDAGRLGPCIDPQHPVASLTKAQEKRRKDAEKKRQNPSLFE